MNQQEIISILNHFNDYYRNNRDNRWFLGNYVTTYMMMLTPGKHLAFLKGLNQFRLACESRRYHRNNCNRYTGALHWIYAPEGADDVTKVVYDAAQNSYDRYRF